MEEGKGERYLASGRQYGNALLGVRHQEEEGARQRGATNQILPILPDIRIVRRIAEWHRVKSCN